MKVGPERSADGRGHDVVEGVAEAVEPGGLARIEVGASLGDRLVQRAAGVIGAEPAEQVGGDRDLVLRRQPRVEDRRSALQSRRVDGRGEVGRDQWRERCQGDRDPRVANGEQPGDVMAGALGHQLAREGRESHPHPGAGEDLRDDGPPRRGGGEQRQAADPTGHQEAAGDRAGQRIAREP